MKKILLTALLIASTSLYGVNTKPTLDYLNTLRIEAGLLPFTKELDIERAAQNHSNYLNAHDEGHYETEGLSYYTGTWPKDRVFHAGYSSTPSEVISYAQTSNQAIDLLFSGIYHRFALLSIEHNEVGIGIKSDIYTLELGNKWVDSICAGPETGSSSPVSAFLYCKNTDKKIGASVIEDATKKDKKNYKNLILWPPNQGNDIPVVFYEEDPDPLPNTSVSGYPIGVEFNDFKFKTPPTVNSFTVENALTQQSEDDILIMNSDNDPNGMFTRYQTAFFPSSVLDWGTPYNAEIIYTYKGTQYSKTWCFQTRTLQGVAQRVYTIKHNQNISLNILRGEKYAINIVPNDGNDLVGWPISWSGTDDAITFDNYAGSVFTISSDSPIGSTFGVEFENGQKINFTISDSDQANFPKNVSCLVANDFDFDHDGLLNSVDLDDDNDGVLDVDDDFPLDGTKSTKFMAIEQFVTRFYDVILGRSPDSAGLNDWSAKLEGLSKSGVDIAKGFIFSVEYNIDGKTNIEYLNTLYSAFFNRTPDTGGFDNWMSLMKAGTTREEVLDGFLNSEEFKNLADSYGIIANATPVELFVSRFYKQTLGRSPDAVGLADWSNKLNSGEASGSDVAYGFVFSGEFIAKELNHTEYLTVLYKAFFARDPDQSGLDGWLAALSSSRTKEDVLDGFLYSAEFSNLCREYGILPH